MTYEQALKEAECGLLTYYEKYPELTDQIEFQKIAINALKKQIPQKPKRVDDGSFYWFECPVCGEGTMPSENCYCGFCGQKLDWSDIE